MQYQIVTFISLMLLASIGWAGGRESGGGDLTSARSMAAWFTTGEPVRACLQIHPYFVVDHRYGEEARPLLKSAIEEAGKIWGKYITERLGDYLYQVRIGFDDQAVDLPTEVKVLERCDGTEEVIYYFGVRNEDTLREIRRYDRPLGLSKQMGHFPAHGRGKGFIYIEGWRRPTWEDIDPMNLDYVDADELPIWRDKAVDRMLPLLLHEQGHTLGIGYVRGTVMDQQAEMLLDVPTGQLREIDYTQTLVRPSAEVVSGIWRRAWDGGDSPLYGPAQLSVEFQKGIPIGRLVQYVGEEKKEFKLQLLETISSTFNSANVFYIWRVTDRWPLGRIFYFPTSSSIWVGYLVEISEESPRRIPIYLYHNHTQTVEGGGHVYLMKPRDGDGRTGLPYFESESGTDMRDRIQEIELRRAAGKPEVREEDKKYRLPYPPVRETTPIVTGALEDLPPSVDSLFEIQCGPYSLFGGEGDFKDVGVHLDQQGSGAFTLNSFDGHRSKFYFDLYWNRDGKLRMYISTDLREPFIRQYFRSLDCERTLR